MKIPILESESFSSANKYYFIDFKRASNHSDYIKITRSDRNNDGTYGRQQIVIFEENFHFFIEAFSMLFTSMIHKKEYEMDRETSSGKKSAHGIKSWDPQERPREKLMERGRRSLTAAELLAIIIGSGRPGDTAVDLAQKVLDAAGNDLEALGKMSLTELCRIRGIGQAKALAIISAMELNERKHAAGKQQLSCFG